mmetsp:Transcript_39942/g.80535  ORF Transcript_39942/g.80535 Transcript_39942/m.80535 type:complete len:98 (-) Transcript_39942:768-1061(-)
MRCSHGVLLHSWVRVSHSLPDKRSLFFSHAQHPTMQIRMPSDHHPAAIAIDANGAVALSVQERHAMVGGGDHYVLILPASSLPEPTGTVTTRVKRVT